MKNVKRSKLSMNVETVRSLEKSVAEGPFMATTTTDTHCKLGSGCITCLCVPPA